MKKVLLATDGSSYAQEAAWFLAHLPHDNKFELTVLSVLDVPGSDQSSPTPGWVLDCLDREKILASATFTKIEEMFEGANVTLRHVVREGHGSETIVKTATEQKTDLVVVGARGHSAVTRMLLGSTSDFVATHAPCSVLVVRPTEIRECKRPLQVAICYEESKPAQAALEEVSEINWGEETDVRVLSVISYMTGTFHKVPVDSETLKNATMATLRRAAERLRDSAPNTQIRLIENDHVGEGLVEFVEDHKCDLVVVGESPRSIIGRVLFGSVSRFVLRHAPSSVWITRNRMTEGLREAHRETQVVSS